MKVTRTPFRALAPRPPLLATLLAGCFALLSLLPPANTRADNPPPLEDDHDNRTPLVRGAMARTALAGNNPHRFSFATDGPGIITLAWTQPEKSDLAVKLTGPEGEAIEHPAIQHHKHTRPNLRTLTLPLDTKGRHTLTLTADKDTQVHIGSAWMAFAEWEGRVGQRQARPFSRPAGATALGRADWIAGLPRVPIGHIGESASPSGRPKSFGFKAQGPGIFSVALLSTDKDDMTIEVKDVHGKTLPNGQCDIDYNGNPGAEFLGVALHAPGDYEVVIQPLGGGGRYQFGGSWVSLQGVDLDKP